MGLATTLRDMRTMRTLFSAAESERAARGDATAGPEHLVVAALALDASAAPHGLTAEAVRASIARVHAASPAAAAATGSSSLRDVFGLARRIAAGRQLQAIHVVQAAARPKHGTMALVFADLGIDRAARDTHSR